MHERIIRFPVQQRSGLGARIDAKIFTGLEQLIRAYYAKDKLALLAEINLELEILRYYLRLCKDLKLLSIKQYEYALRLLFDIGQSLGGWIKQQQTRTYAKA